MQLTVQADFTKLNSVKAILESLTKSRGLELSPPKPELDGLVKDLGLSIKSLKKAKTLLSTHLQKGSDILVYGDYDADGITATAVLWQTLQDLAKGSSARILPFIPNRESHGYGLSATSLADIFSQAAFKDSAYPDFSPALIFTVDTGIVANVEIETLVQRGIDVILTDHHQASDQLPPATVVLHSIVTSGAGLAWVVALFLADAALAVYNLLALATIGIVADLLPLTGLNRQLVTHGLKLLHKTHNPGLLSLLKLAGIEPSTINTGHLNFALAPRLNAAGRLGDATDALRLLVSQNSRQVTQLAQALNTQNITRQALTEAGIKEALQQKPAHRLIIAASEEYHEGVIGLIAGKLAERWHRPALALSLKGDLVKGSARSVKGVDITSLLRRFSSLFSSVGGHELAAGFSLPRANLSELTKKILEYADQEIDESLLVPHLTVDAELKLTQTSLTLAKALEQLAPYGMGNPKPVFFTRNLTVLEDKALGTSGQHRRLTLSDGQISREAIWFNATGHVPEGRLTQLSELVYTLDINVWQNKEKLQLVVKAASV